MRGLPVVVMIALAACEPESPTCIQNLGVDIANVTVRAYNTRISGNTQVDLVYMCPDGGSAHIVGTTQINPVAWNLTLEFTTCSDNALPSTLTLNGVMQSTKAGATQTDSATDLYIVSKQSTCNADPVDAICAVSVTVVDASISTAEICGLTYP
jgi:hypothetical protein